MSEKDGATLYDIVSKVTGHPCGVEIDNLIVSNTGRSTTMRCIGFPLQRDENETGCVVWINQSGATMRYGMPAVETSNVTLKEWIDIGEGVPGTD